MKTKTTLLAQYRNSNEDERLALYVFHRELRSEFSTIDLEDDGAWGDLDPVAVDLPKLGGVWAAVKKLFQGGATKHRAPIRH